MTILFATNSIIHFDGPRTADTTAGRYHATRVPYNINIPDSSTFCNQRYDHLATTTGTTWYQLEMYVPSASSAGEDNFFFEIKDAGGLDIVTFQMRDGLVRWVVEGTGAATGFSGNSIMGNFISSFKVRITQTTVTEVEIFLNGASMGSVSNTDLTGRTSPVRIDLNSDDAVNGNQWSFSEIIASEIDMFDFGMSKLSPISDGTDNAFTGAFGLATDDDNTTGVFADTIGQQQSYNMTTYVDTDLISHYHTSCVVTSGSASVTNYKFYLLIGGVRYYGADLSIPASTTQMSQAEWALDPSDSAPWTAAKVNAVQPGIEII